MSRNFELLQQFGKEPDAFSSATFTPEEPEIFAEPESFVSPPSPLENGSTEEVRTLVQRVFLLSAGQAPHTVVFAASESGDGCSWICARAAEALARQVSGSVCLVDANLRAPGLHQQFEIPNHHGLSDALLQNEPMATFVTALSPPNLSIVSCGSAPEGVQGLLTSNRMRSRLKELRAMFDYVLVDASAMNSSNDAIVLGAVSDGAILVLKANSSRKETARNAVQEFQAAKVRVLGAVLNQRTFPIPEALYNKL
jgi:capsular exopolysaccharide synthesis family protein